jgi:hypothetical protein
MCVVDSRRRLHRVLCGEGALNAAALGKALAPFGRVTRRMKDGVNRDRGLRMLVEDGVRKAAYEGAAVALVNDRVHLGTAPDAFNARIDRTQELLTQPGSPAFIPDTGICDIRLGFRSDHQLSGHGGHAPYVSPLPRAVPKPGFSIDSLFCAPVPAFASHEQAPFQVRPQGRPIDPPQVEASLRDSDQRSKLRANSYGSPLPILSNCGIWRQTRAVPMESVDCGGADT